MSVFVTWPQVYLENLEIDTLMLWLVFTKPACVNVEGNVPSMVQFAFGCRRLQFNRSPSVKNIYLNRWHQPLH